LLSRQTVFFFLNNQFHILKYKTFLTLFVKKCKEKKEI
jgi:hypothetical protein